MALNKAILAAFKAASHIKPDIERSYRIQRVAEDASGKIVIPNPRCRIDEATATMPDGYDVPLRVFTPLEVEFSLESGIVASEDNRGTILFFHGGGWANGSADFYIEACRTMSMQLERRVVSVDYRRSPEHRFPQAPEDCYEVARQLFAGILLPDVDPSRIVLMGDSAGGNLAAVVSLMARDRGEFSVGTQVLVYPLTYDDHGPESPFSSLRENGDDYLLTTRDIEGYVGLYLSKPDDAQSPYFAPLIAQSLANQPRTLVVSAEYCPLRDEGETFAARIENEGGRASCYRMLDAVHGYLLYPSILSLVKDTYRIIRHFLDGEELVQKGAQRWMLLLEDD